MRGSAGTWGLLLGPVVSITETQVPGSGLKRAGHMLVRDSAHVTGTLSRKLHKLQVFGRRPDEYHDRATSANAEGFIADGYEGRYPKLSHSLLVPAD